MRSDRNGCVKRGVYIKERERENDREAGVMFQTSAVLSSHPSALTCYGCMLLSAIISRHFCPSEVFLLFPSAQAAAFETGAIQQCSIKRRRGCLCAEWMAPIQSEATTLTGALSGNMRGFYLAKQQHLYLLTGYPRWTYDSIYKDRKGNVS